MKMFLTFNNSIGVSFLSKTKRNEKIGILFDEKKLLKHIFIK